MLTAVVIDEHRAARRRTATLLRLAGWHVEETGGYWAGLLAAAAIQPDLVVTELSVDGGDGLELLERLRRAGCPARFLVLTERPTAQVTAAAARVGATCLPTPLDPRRLVGFLRQPPTAPPAAPRAGRAAGPAASPPASAPVRVSSSRADLDWARTRPAEPVGGADGSTTTGHLARWPVTAAGVVAVGDQADLARRLAPRRRRTAVQARRGLGPYRLVQLLVVLLGARTDQR